MIGKLTGRLDYAATDHVLIDVGGVGYIVHCSERTLRALPPKGEAVSVYTELLVREDLLQLFGFLSPYEREWHRLLVSVQGVGAKASMAILGTLGAEGVARAVALGDWGSVRAAQGVGPKLAQRVVNELQDKAPAAMAMGGDLAASELVTTRPGPDIGHDRCPLHRVPRRPRRSRPCRTSAMPLPTPPARWPRWPAPPPRPRRPR
jgi:Holliday junction DNA helicase RuvA